MTQEQLRQKLIDNGLCPSCVEGHLHLIGHLAMGLVYEVQQCSLRCGYERRLPLNSPCASEPSLSPSR